MSDVQEHDPKLEELAREFPSFPAWYKATWIEEYWESTKETTPTQAMPGSEEKIRILQQRYENGEPLHHPDDLFLCGDNS